MVKIAVDCKRGQIGLVSLVVYIVVINGICTRSSLFHPVRAFQVPMIILENIIAPIFIFRKTLTGPLGPSIVREFAEFILNPANRGWSKLAGFTRRVYNTCLRWIHQGRVDEVFAKWKPQICSCQDAILYCPKCQSRKDGSTQRTQYTVRGLVHKAIELMFLQSAGFLK